MRETYIEEYKSDCQLKGSLELLKHHLIFNCSVNESDSRFIIIFLRLADRCLYHSKRTWSLFIANLDVPFLHELGDNAWRGTDDIESKYEIEAYLNAAKSLFEKNFVGIDHPKKQNILGNSFRCDKQLLKTIKSFFKTSEDKFFLEANKIRNHSCHINKQLCDEGYKSQIVMSGDSFKVALPNVYEDADANSIDLAELFVSTHKNILKLLLDVRDVLLKYILEQHELPNNDHYLSIESPFGNMIVCLGPKGFEFKSFNK